MESADPNLTALPSVDWLLQQSCTVKFIELFGRQAVTRAIRRTLDAMRVDRVERGLSRDEIAEEIVQAVAHQLAEERRPSLRPVFNLTGTVLHTNLGRALLPEEAIDAMVTAARSASNLEYDLAAGKRGDRDSHLERALCRLTGAEAATVVNNNAAAVLLVLNSLANRKEVPTSRGELIEIGGSFRMPEIMARSGAKLVEIGTTNRTHLRDYQDAIGPKTGLVMKIHPSNYVIEGFTATVHEAEIAKLCHARNVPFVVDLGSGTLVDLSQFGLPREPTPADALKNGADVVTFSADKLLGGPQAGIIVGRKEVIARIKRNPLKRALRVDKVTIAALAAILALYEDPDRLILRLPTLRMLARPLDQIRALAHRLITPLADLLSDAATVEMIECGSQIGSGALPTQQIPSACISIKPLSGRQGQGKILAAISVAFRSLPVPVIGRIHNGALLLDLRCLDDEDTFLKQLSGLVLGVPASP